MPDASHRIDALLAQLCERVDGETSLAVDRTYELAFVGVDGKWYLDFGPEVAWGRDAPERTPCRLGMNVDDLDDLLSGRATLAVLFQTRRLRVFSDVGDAMRLDAVFARKSG